MMRIPSPLAAILLGVSLAAAVAAQPVTAIRGTWAGTIGARSEGWRQGEQRLELRVDGSESRLSIKLAAPGWQLLSGEFEPGERPGLFRLVPPQERGLMSLFRGSPKVNPLEGAPLIWARRAGDSLVVYSLTIERGPYVLDRLELKPSGDRLSVAFDRQEHGRVPLRFVADLQRQRS
jgi:hypothetical protein